ncbi:MAG TPA: hypothetical protein VFW33_02930 [Gemmataceae bacterium]|nr:hypothetical protein [Gemmataceae bacterium]
MAGRVLNRRELRRQSDAAESADLDEVADEADAAEEAEDEEEVAEHAEDEAPPAKVKAKAAPKSRKPRKPKAAPRMRARWGVFDASMKQVAVFDYKDRAAADAKVGELLASKKTGTFFLQLVKEAMPEDAAPAPGVR